jgi:hypothetical protein
MAARKRRPTKSTRNGTVDPSRPLAKPSRELFAQDVAAGVPVKDAYVRADYKGNNLSRYELRRCADIDARVNWLLAKRIEDDTKARHKAEKKIPDAREWVIRELERLAFNDVRDLVQWDKRAVLDDDGQVVGFEDIMVVKPSRLLTPDQAASVRSVTAKAGQLKLETHDKLGALEKLAKVLGIYQETPAVQAVTVNQVNVGGDNALEAARRLAFALAKLSHTPGVGEAIEGDGAPVSPKEPRELG